MDARMVIEGLFAAATFLAAFWIKTIRDDMRLLVATVTDHGERIAVLESQMKRLDK